MKLKVTLLIFLGTILMGYSQKEPQIKGTVVCMNYALKGIEISNFNSKNTTITNEIGQFSILAKAGDALVFVSKGYYYKTIILKQSDFGNPSFTILLIKKPEELDEVVIFKTPKIKLDFNSKWEKEKQYELSLEKALEREKKGLPAGISSGVNLIAVGVMIVSLFIKKKEKIKKPSEITFKTLVGTSLDNSFFQKELLLKPEDVPLFLEFCDADPESKVVIKGANPLKTMDFLFAKKEEFKAVLSSPEEIRSTLPK